MNVEVNPTLDRSVLLRGLDRIELAESTAIGDALAVGTRLLVNAAEDDENRDTDIAPGVIVLLSDGETTVGQPTAEGTRDAAEANVPVFTIAFGTADGTIIDPFEGEIVPVPVRPAELESVAEATGGQAFEAQTGDELVDAYDDIQESLGDTLGDEVEVIDELTWQWAMAAFALLALGWGLSLLWLRGMV